MSGASTSNNKQVLKSEWMDGFRDLLVVMMPILTFGIMFGAASSAAGYSIGVSVWSSAAIFAGASQFVFLEVFKEGIPGWSVVLAVFAVNFRHILYSAAIANKVRDFNKWQKAFGFFLLTDLQFAVTENRFFQFQRQTKDNAILLFRLWNFLLCPLGYWNSRRCCVWIFDRRPCIDRT